jgi:hypothetical protein
MCSRSRADAAWFIFDVTSVPAPLFPAWGIGIAFCYRKPRPMIHQLESPNLVEVKEPDEPDSGACLIRGRRASNKDLNSQFGRPQMHGIFKVDSRAYREL